MDRKEFLNIIIGCGPSTVLYHVTISKKVYWLLVDPIKENT
jgi:hypothetical protein